MDQYNILKILKDLGDDTGSKRAFFDLIRFPLVLEYLSESGKLHSVVEQFKTSSENWSILDICKSAAGFPNDFYDFDLFESQQSFEVENSTDYFDLEQISGIKSLEQIFPICQKILGSKINIGWQKFFENLKIPSSIANDRSLRFQTILTILFDLVEDKNDFIKGLFSITFFDHGQKILAQLFSLYHPFSKYILNQEKIIPNIPIENFVRLLRDLQYLGEQDLIPKLVNKFANQSLTLTDSCDDTKQQTFIEQIERLQTLKNHLDLYNLSGDRKKYQEILIQINRSLLIINNQLGLTTKATVPELIIDEPNNNNLVNASGLEIPIASSTTLSDRLQKITEIAQSDIVSARTLLEELFRELMIEENIKRIIFHQDKGFVVEPNNLIQIFISFGLIENAYWLLKKLISIWPKNIELLRLLAHLSHDNGAHKDSTYYFSILSLLIELSRDEKIKYASSYEYLGNWKEAFNIYKEINFTSVKDIEKIAGYAYFSGDLEFISLLINENRFGFKSSPMAKIYSRIHNSEKYSEANELINIVKLIPENDEFAINILIDYLKKSVKSETIIYILEECLNNNKNNLHIRNELFNLYKKVGNKEKSQTILKIDLECNSINQKTLETLLMNLIENKDFLHAQQIINLSSDKWILSFEKSKLWAKILIENENFDKAENVIKKCFYDARIDEDSLFDYCLALLNCRKSDFPFGINQEKPELINRIRLLIEEKAHTKNLFFDLLRAEVSVEGKIPLYQKIIKDYSEKGDPESWRIYAGTGKAYFNQNQFDTAIINFRKAFSINSDNEEMFWLIIRCYEKLKMWDEVESLLMNHPLVNRLPETEFIRNLDCLCENPESIRFFEKIVHKQPNELFYKILLAKSYSANEKKVEAINLIEPVLNVINNNHSLYFYCIQILIDSDEKKLAERFIEIFLTNNEKISQDNFLNCIFLYDQINKIDKSISLLNHLNICDPILLAYHAKLEYDIGKVDFSEKLLKNAINKISNQCEYITKPIVSTPEFMKFISENPSKIYIMAVNLIALRKDFPSAIKILRDGLIRFPDDQDILCNLIELLHYLGKNEEITVIVEDRNKSDLIVSNPELMCLFGEIALSNHHEIDAARHLTYAILTDSNNPRVKMLQARMILKNGYQKESQMIYAEAKKEIDINLKEQNILGLNGPFTFSNLWAAEAALEFDDYDFALPIIQREISRIGKLLKFNFIFLSAFVNKLEKEFIDKQINVTKNRKKLTDEEKTLFFEIRENFKISSSIEDEASKNLINRCIQFIDDDMLAHENAITMLPDENNINSIILGIFKTRGKEAAEIFLNSVSYTPENEMFLALLEMEESPESSLIHVKNILSSDSTKNIAYIILAIVEKRLGNLTDAYAAICLALENEPDEYAWQIMAGDMCKQNGDFYNSILHYEKAQKIINHPGFEKEIQNLYISIEHEKAIPVLEEQLSQDPNIKILIQLVRIFIKYGNFRKAINLLQDALKRYPQESIPLYWLAKIALRLKNPNKAMEYTDKALKSEQDNEDYICLKANILKITNGYLSAIQYIDEKIMNYYVNSSTLILQKAEIILENESNEAALAYINSIEKSHQNSDILVKKAKLEMMIGNIEQSESIAEELLDHKDNISEALSILGEIAQNRGELDRAIDFYIKAIKAAPQVISYYLKLSEIYQDKKESFLSLRTLEDGLKVNPENFDLLFNIGLKFYKQGYYKEAKKRIKKAIRLDPENKNAKNILEILENSETFNTEVALPQYA